MQYKKYCTLFFVAVKPLSVFYRCFHAQTVSKKNCTAYNSNGVCVCVCVLQENPYVMLRPNHQDLEGNDRYEGFCVDMLKELADILKFKYRIRLVGDRLYGVPGANGTWTGMVGELISRVCG